MPRFHITEPNRRLLALRAVPEGPDALPALLAAASDPSPDIVRVALRRLATSGQPAAAVELLSRMLDVDPELTEDFALALASLRDREASEVALEALVGGGPHRRIAAATALTVLAVPEQTPAICGGLEDPLAAVRSRVLQALARVGSRENAPTCARLLSDPDPGVRSAAVEAVIGAYPEVRPALEKLATDPAPAVRRALAKRFGRLGAASAELLLADRHRSVREAAIASSGRAQAGTLTRILEADPVVEVRMAAARRLAEMGVESGRTALVQALSDRSAMVRAATLASLRDPLGRRQTLACLLDALPRASPKLRKAIVHAFARLDAREAEDSLAELAEDPERDARLAVVHSAERLFGSDWRALSRLTQDADPAVANAASIVIERAGRSG